MNIVAWLDTLQRELTDAGQERVAYLVDHIPELTHDNRREQVEALLPEALAAAKALKNSWLEIYFKHWEMRNRLSNNGEGETALPDIVALLELAHREENLECPQSVCTTHDIADCYGNVDGPGWAEERKAVCEETLARLTPAYPCYICLNREYIFALRDQERYEEALARLDALERALLEHGEEKDIRLIKDRAVVRRCQGKYEEALGLLEEAERQNDGLGWSTGDSMQSAIRKAELLALLGRPGEAGAALPAWKDIAPADYPGWAKAVWHLAEQEPGYNSWSLGACLQQGLEHADRVEAHRHAVEIAETHARLALSRGAAWVAVRALAVAEKHLPRLRSPHGADQALEALKREIEAFAPDSLPVPAGELLQWLDSCETRDPEQEAQWLLAALEASPGNADLAVGAVSALEACRAYDEAVRVYKTAIRSNETEKGFLLSRLLLVYLDSGRHAEALELAGDVEEHEPLLTHWTRARVAEASGEWDAALREVEKALAFSPENEALLKMAVNANRKRKRFKEAVSLGKRMLEAAAAREEELGGLRWELMTSASAAADWETVRATAKEAGIDLEGESGPVEEDWGWVRLRFEEDGGWNEYFGLRTGPATAKVISIANPGDVQHVRDLVVFDPAYIEPLPEDEEERERYIVPHTVLHVLEPAGYTAWICDGADPGEEAFDAFCQALEEQNYAVRIRQRGDYSIRNPLVPKDPEAEKGEGYDPAAAGEGLPGIYFAVAAPPGVSALDAYTLARGLTKNWEHPLCLYSMAKAAGVDTAEQIDIIERYEL